MLLQLSVELRVLILEILIVGAQGVALFYEHRVLADLLLEILLCLLLGATHPRLESTESTLHVLPLLRELLVDLLVVAAICHLSSALLSVRAIESLDAFAPQMRLGVGHELVQVAPEETD